MSAAFDPIAAGYDADFTDSFTGRAQRERVYSHLRKLLPQPKHLLELSCGTGADALWLAEQGHYIIATDISSTMVEYTTQKVQDAGFSTHVNTAVIAAEQLREWNPKTPPFELIFSNFAGLNCVSPQEWPNVAAGFAQHTQAGSQIVLVLLGRFCWWETLYFLLKGQWQKAWRRRQKGAVSAALGEGQFVDTWYYSPREIAHFCEPYFRLQAVYPIGLALPPSYLDQWLVRWPKLGTALVWLENKFGHWSRGAHLADHYLVVLEKK